MIGRLGTEERRHNSATKKKEAVGNGAMGAKIRRTAVASLIQKKKGKKTKQKTREREREIPGCDDSHTHCYAYSMQTR